MIVPTDIDQFTTIKHITYHNGKENILQYIVDARVDINYSYYNKEIFNMVNLESFNVSKFKVKKIPIQIQNLIKLECLCIVKGMMISRTSLENMRILSVHLLKRGGDRLLISIFDEDIVEIDSSAKDFIY